MASRKNGHGISTLHLVLFALLRRGGDDKFVSTDEVALEAFKLFPGKFCWDEHTHLPQWDRVRQWLSEAKKPKHGTLVEGFSGERGGGWRLTAAGLRLLRFKEGAFVQVECAPAADAEYARCEGPDLVAVALAETVASARRPSFPNLVAQCYARFPKAFELPGYEGWPDASRVMNLLRRAVDEGFVEAPTDTSDLALTPKGEAFAEETKRRLKLHIPGVLLAEIGKGLAGKSAGHISEITKSRAWQSYMEGAEITRASACEALQCTVESHRNAIRRALEKYQLAAEQVGRRDVLDFLAQCALVIGLHPGEAQPQGEREGTNGS